MRTHAGAGQGRLIAAGFWAGVLFATVPTVHANDPKPEPKLDVVSLFVAEPQSETPLLVRIVPPDAAPRSAFLRIRGLPGRVSLTDGHMVTPGVWAVPLFALASLRAVVPAGVSGRSDLQISLVTVDGQVLAEARSALVVAQVNLRAAPERAETVAPPQPPGGAVGVPPLAFAPGAAKPADEPPPSTKAPPIAAVAPPPAMRSAPPPSEPKAAPERASPERPALTDEQRRAFERLVQQGDRALQQGSVAAARQFYLRAAEGGLGLAAFKLAETYDPEVLKRLAVQGMIGDSREARIWYQRARDLGEAAAVTALRRLGP